MNYLIITGDFSLVRNYLRPSNNSRKLIFNINAVVWIVILCLVRKRICATTCYLNPSEKDCFLAKMSEISGFDAIIFRIFKYIAFR